MATYANQTEVSSDRSITELRRTILRYGAKQFAHMEDDENNRAVIAFAIGARQVKFILPMPERKDFRLTPTGKVKTVSAQDAAYEQAVRQRWRALNLVVKAKLEAVESGIAEFDQEFYGYMVLPGGSTVYETTKQQVADAIESGKMTPLISIEGVKR